MAETVQAILDRMHRENCLVCSPESKPNADAFVNGLYDLFTETPPKLLRAMRGRNVSPMRARNARGSVSEA